MTPTQRTLQFLRDCGRPAAVVERWNPHAKVRQDLFGFIDVVALGGSIVAIQCTSGSNVAARVTKITTECRDQARWWLLSGGRIEVWGWRKVKVKRGGKAMRWEVRVVPVTLEMCGDDQKVRGNER